MGLLLNTEIFYSPLPEGKNADAAELLNLDLLASHVATVTISVIGTTSAVSVSNRITLLFMNSNLTIHEQYPQGAGKVCSLRVLILAALVSIVENMTKFQFPFKI